MPLTFTVDHGRHRLHAVAHGAVTAAHVAQFFSDRISAGVQEYDQVVDVSGAQLFVQEVDLVPLANDRKAALAGLTPGRTAWVAPSDEQFTRALSLKAQLEKLGILVSVFHTKDEAIQWLDEGIQRN